MLLSCFKRKPWRQHRKWIIFTRAIILSILVLLLYRQIIHRLSPDQATSSIAFIDPTSQRIVNPLLTEQATFWRDLYQIILDNDPQCEQPPEVIVPLKLDIGFDPSHSPPRPDVLWIGNEDIKRLQDAHSNFIKEITTQHLHLVYRPASRGLVMTAGYKQLPVLVISLRMLRRTKSQLPVEVFLAESSDYDPNVCEIILPKLNAKCLLFSDIFQAANSGVSIDKYQYKIMAILFSSFENVLLLDSDAFPISNPDILFDNEPFNSTGMITWPDFWYSSESPYFFQITNQNHPPLLNIRPSTESGEIMINKSKHNLSLCLTTYYNYYGPDYYYLLQSQNAPGQGDKETFGWATRILNESIYTIHSPVIALGHFDSTKEFFGSAMLQHDPISDYQRKFHHDNNLTTSKYEASLRKGPNSTELFITKNSSSSSSSFMFIHANFPKFDPSTIFLNQKFGTLGATKDTNGTNIRSWLNESMMIKMFGFDIEKLFWSEIKTVACEFENHFNCWKGKSGICDGVKKYWNDVFA